MIVKAFLVHGTRLFWQKPTWIEEASDLPTALKRRIGDALSLKAIRWSGENSFPARLAAKDTIVRELSHFDFDEAACIICSHSHGGGAVAYALRERPDLARKVAGVVFLSTPFITFRILQNWRYLLDGLLAPVALVGLLVILDIAYQLCLAIRFIYNPHIFINSGQPMPLQPALIFSSIIFLGTSLSLYLLIIFNRLKLKLAHRMLRRALRVSDYLSCNIPAETRALFVRVTGDEAATFLVLIQQVGWWMSAFNVVVARLYAIFAWPWRIRRVRRPLIILVILLLWSLFCGFAFAELFGRMTNLFRPDSTLMQIGRDLRILFGATWYYQTNSGLYEWRILVPLVFYVGIFWIAFAAIAFLVASFCMSLTFFVANWIIGWFFGGVPFLVSGIIQGAAEPTPPGEWPLVHVTWTGRGRKKQSIFWRHSNPYAEPKVVSRIVDWIENGRAIIESVRALIATRSPSMSHCAPELLQASRHHAQKRTAHATQQDRPDIVKRRQAWFAGQLDLDPERRVFVDETWASTNMERRHGRCARSERLRVGVPTHSRKVFIQYPSLKSRVFIRRPLNPSSA